MNLLLIDNLYFILFVNQKASDFLYISIYFQEPWTVRTELLYYSIYVCIYKENEEIIDWYYSVLSKTQLISDTLSRRWK